MLIYFVLLLSAEPTAMFRGDASHRGVYHSPQTPELKTVKWKFGTKGKVFSTPALADGVIYFGSTDRSLYAVRSGNGELVWKFETQGSINSSPSIANGMVYFLSADGNFYCVEAVTGKARWKFRTQGERRFTAPGIHGAIPRTEVMPDPYDVFLSSPVISGGTAYFGSGDHFVYAVDAITGELRWKFKTGNVVHASPAVSGDVVYVGSWDRQFYALDARSGQKLWSFETGDDQKLFNQVGIASSAAISEGNVYFGCRDGHFYALDQKTGALRWKVDNKMGWVIASPAVHDGFVYFPTSDGMRFKAVAASTGEVLFNIENKAVSFSSPALVNDTLFFGSSDGWLQAIDSKTGAVKARFQTDGNRLNAGKYIDASGKINSRALYPDYTLDGMIIGLDRMFSLGSVISSPVVAEGVVFFGSTDGNVYAVQ